MPETQYREVYLGPKKVEIPKDWGANKLSEFASFKNGKAVDHSDSENEEFLIYGSNGPIGSYEDYNLEKGLIIGRVGAVGEVHKTEEKAWVSDNAILMEVDEEKADLDFIYDSLSRRNLKVLATKTAQPLLNQSTVKTVKLPLPPLPEQRRIAEILSTVDEAIQQTDEIIETSKELKKGLMQDLLTKGIGHNEFKEVRVGPKVWNIPQEWDISNLHPDNELATEVTDGSHHSPDQEEGEEYFYATVTNLSEEGIDYASCGKINQEQYEEMVKGGCKPEKGDVLFSKDGTVGISTVFDDNEEVVLLSSIAIIRNTESINSDFLKFFLSSRKVTDQIKSFKSGTAIRRVVLRDIKKFSVPVPPLDEQREIAEKISVVDEKIRQEEEYREKLEELKKGLMQDLLTGKVRTT